MEAVRKEGRSPTWLQQRLCVRGNRTWYAATVCHCGPAWQLLNISQSSKAFNKQPFLYVFSLPWPHTLS